VENHPNTAPWDKWPRPRRVGLMVLTEPDESRNELGEPALSWKEAAKIWASIRPLSGRELWQAQQVQADVTHACRLRFRTGIDATMELDLQGRRLRIVAVLNLEERNRTLELLCQEQPLNA
jgi:SPP1 family predicted phage head-tail adaptor